MKKSIFPKYVIIWLIMLAIFNVICFVVPSTIDGGYIRTGSFWVGYIFISLAFLGQLICAWIALKSDSVSKLFYNIPLITISYTGLILMLIVGSLFMIIPALPVWLGIILCVLIFAFTAIAVIQSSTAADIVQQKEEKIRTRTSTIRNLTTDTENLIYQAQNEAIRYECQKVFDALRYSDPMSSPELTEIEVNISGKLHELSDAVIKNDIDNAQKISNDLVILIGNRNRKCRLLK